MKNAIEIKKIDIGEMKSYSNILIMGKRETGKTYLTTDILFHINKNIPKGCIMSATDSRHYANIIPPSYNYDEYNSNIIEKITKDKFETNKNICSININNNNNPKYHSVNNNNDNNDNNDNDNDSNSFLVLDNCLYDHDWKTKYLRFLLMNSKNFKHTIIVTQSYPYVTPTIRENFDYIFVLRERNERMRNKIYESFVDNLALSFESFCQIMDQCTESYECLVIDNTSVSYKIQENLFWYKASEHKDFYINCE